MKSKSTPNTPTCSSVPSSQVANQERFEQLSQIKLPFGKFRGRTFAEVPLSYLQWMAHENLTDVVLQMDVEEYLAHPLCKQEHARLEAEKATDIKLLPRAWRGRR